MMLHKICVVSAVLAILAAQARADSSRATSLTSAEPAKGLAEVRVGGDARVEEEAIRSHLSSSPGEPLNEEAVDKDIRAVYAMGFFSNVEARLSEENGRTVLTYWVYERPLIRELRIEGNKGLAKEDLENALKIHPHTILNPMKIRRGIEEAKKAYEKKGRGHHVSDRGVRHR